jgi:branched-chain amino acid transport system substrate-binding protein
MVLGAQNATPGPAAPSTLPVIKVGWLGPLSGPYADDARAELDAVTLYAEEVNARGGIELKGQRYLIKVVAADDRLDLRAIEPAVKRLVDFEHVAFIVGPMCSAEVWYAAPLVNAARVPLIATTATGTLVTEPREGFVNPYVFRACFDDKAQGEAIGQYAAGGMGAKRVLALVNEDDPYSTTLAEYFRKSFLARGGEAFDLRSYADGDGPDTTTLLEGADAEAYDLVFMPTYSDTVSGFAKEARKLGITLPFLGGDGWSHIDFGELADGRLDGSAFIGHVDLGGEAVKAFRQRYAARFGRDVTLHSCMAWDAMAMGLDALGRATSLSGKAIATALATCDIQGLSGHLVVGPRHDLIGKTVWAFRLSSAGFSLADSFPAPVPGR